MLFVAEIGSNHKGIPALAFEMIREAALAGANIAKFQLGHPMGEGVQAMRHWPTEHADQLAEWCDYWGVEFMASIWNERALLQAQRLGMSSFKVAHQMVENKELTEAVLACGLPTYISGLPVSAWAGYPNARAIYCQPYYPTYPNQVRLPNGFGEKAEYHGYSSHVPGIVDALMAIGRGALYIEKHMTLDKTEESIRDNHFALMPDEFSEMVLLGKQMAMLAEVT